MDYNKTDTLLRENLRINAEPPQTLVTRVKLQMLQARPAQKSRRLPLKLTTAAVTLAILMVLSTSVYAVSRLLQGSDVADAAGDTALAAAFGEENTLGRLDIYETQEAGDYRFTLTELVRGSDITDMVFSGAVTGNRLYTILAIERLDGTAMPESGYQFLASPLIQGYSPVDYNVFSLNSAATDVVHEGVLYRILQCDDIAIFADKGLKLVVSEDMQFLDAIVFHETSGSFSLNPEYPKAAVLFELPIPAEYADAEKAARYLEESEAKNAEPDSNVDTLNPIQAEMSDLAFWEDAAILEGSLQVLTVNEAGQYNYSYMPSSNADVPSSLMILATELELMFQEAGGQTIIVSIASDNTGFCSAVMMEKAEDGAVTAWVLEKTVSVSAY